VQAHVVILSYVSARSLIYKAADSFFFFFFIFAQRVTRANMDVDETPPDDSVEKRYAQIAEKAAAAIAAEGLPSTEVNNRNTIQRSLPQLPRYQPPPPVRPVERLERCCRMFFPTSGHIGFDTVKLSCESPPVEIVREMIIYETRLRLSDSIQQLMDEYHTDENAIT
jgi:hypothetical protein